MRRVSSSHRLVVLLAVSFALTIVSFLAAGAVAEYEAWGIRDAAHTISRRSLPATEELANVRTELRRLDSLVDEVPDVGTNGDRRTVEALRAELAQSRSALRRSWSAYVSLPLYAGERELIDAAEADMRESNASLDEALRLGLGEDHVGARREVDARTRAAIARTDEAVRAAADLNRQIAIDAANKIAIHHEASRTWGAALHALSAVFAAAAAYFVIRVVVRLWRFNQGRLSELEHFAGRVAHDIRSPLATVSFSLDMAKRQPDITDKTRSYLERGIQTLHRVGQLVDGLLVFAVAGRPPPDGRGVRVADVLDGIVDDARLEAEGRGITIDYEHPDPTLAAGCSPGVLTSMTSNFVTNAMKYMTDGPIKMVTIRARAVEKGVRLEVADTGPGIPPPLRPRVFDPHVRGAESTIPGLGLGLATVRRLAEAHGGSVGLEPNTPTGCIFWFELPSSEAMEEAPRVRRARFTRLRRAFTGGMHD